MTEKPVKLYLSAGAFRTALEERLKQIARSEQTDINRLRRQVAFDRLLARLFESDAGQPWALKGGYALELRLQTARSTVDIDLTIQTSALLLNDLAQANPLIREMLQNATGQAQGDWLEYRIGTPMMDLDGAPYGGARYPVEARMDARIFARFHIDVGIGDVLIEPLERVQCRDWLQFAGIGSSPVAVISSEQHFAEKLHAYTLPRVRPNTRVKDLVDMALLIHAQALDARRTLRAIDVTFAKRKTHLAPIDLPAPPREWQKQFSALAAECNLIHDMQETYASIQSFLLQIASTARKA